jgi:signal transduction histidine kinase
MEETFRTEAEKAFRSGKPLIQKRILYLPIIVRNSEIGMACFTRAADSKDDFSEREMTLALNLASQAAAALKNILLFEQNIKMERLAAIGQTMSMVLHEVKNIVQLATFSQEFLQKGIAGKKEVFIQRGCEGIKKAIKELDGFTYEVLSLTKDYKIEPEPLDPAKILTELKEDLKVKAEQYKIELDFQPGALAGIEGEPRSIYRTLLNLVKNAIEASDSDKPQSFIRVTFRSKNISEYEIVVEDNGIGMNDEAKAKIFQAFFSTKGEKGTGLGLLVIDRTVKAHHGTLNVESEFGKGTKFILTLPKILPKN